MIRKLMIQQDMDIITELDRVLREKYPAKDAERLRRTNAVIQNRDVWNAQQLANELPAISALSAELGGPSTEGDLLKALKS